MNDDDLLFPMHDLELWKRGDLPRDWLIDRQRALLERLRAQAATFQKSVGAGGRRRASRTTPSRKA